MTRRFRVLLPRRVPVVGAWGGSRDNIIVTADEPADAERLYWQQFPEGPVPSAVIEID